MRDSRVADDLRRVCTSCGASLFLRPHLPSARRVLCRSCARVELQGRPLEALVTVATVADIRRALAALTVAEARRELEAGRN